MNSIVNKLSAYITRNKHYFVSLSAVIAITQVQLQAEEFSVIVLPDTQFYSESYPEIYDAQTQWVVDNVDNFDIRFVTHLGDLVNLAANIDQWENAFASMSKLDAAEVPYGALGGNHDFLYPGDYYDPSGTNYLRYFGPQRYEDKAWFGGASPSGLSNYQIIEVDGEKFLFLHLTMETPAAELAWAQTVLNANQDLPTWVSTHRYLFDWWILGAGRYDDFNYTFEPLYRHDGVKSEDFFSNFIAANKQIYLVHCGHNHSEYRQQSENNYGLTVHEVLADYQSDPNGGNGWLRICSIQPEQNQIAVRSYSPTLDEWRTGADSQFVLNVDFDAYKSEPMGTVLQFQNGVAGYNGASDTWINEGSQNTSYGQSSTLIVDDDTENAWFSENPGHAMIKFTDLTQGPVYEGDPAPTRIPSNADISSAQLIITLANDQEVGNTTYRVYPLTRSWSESSTWNSMGGGVNTGTETLGEIATFNGDNNPNNAYGRTLNITQTLNQWIDGSLANNGVAIIRDNTSGNDDGINIHSTEAGTSTQSPKITAEFTYPILNRAPRFNRISKQQIITVNEGEEAKIQLSAQDANSKDPLVFMLNGQDIGYQTGHGTVEHYMLMEDDGRYTFSASVRDDEVSVDIGTVTVVVNNQAPQILSITRPKSSTVGDSIELLVTAADPGRFDQLSYHWDIDNDGQFNDIIGQAAQVSFATAGKHPVSVKVTDDDGASVIESITIDTYLR